MILEGLTVARDLGRLHDIASVLIRYGFGDAVQRLGLGAVLEKAGKALHWQDTATYMRMPPPERFCKALQELGPTFVKLGQVLSTRVDLFAPEWIEEFEKLQDRLPAIPFEELLPQLQEDLGADPHSIFPVLDKEPLAAASIAQTHRAELADGTAVVLKIRRPDIRSTVEADLRLLSRFAELAEQEIPELARYRPKDIVHQFARSMRWELDLARECHNAERVAVNFADDPHITIPRVYWHWTGERINVQQFIQGIPGSELRKVDSAGLDRKLLARRGAHAVLKMILEDGFFHADPHPGNVFYLPGEGLAFIDFGMMGRLSDRRLQQVIRLFFGLVARDSAGVTDILMEWSGDMAIDSDVLAMEIDSFIDHYHGMSLKQLKLNTMLTELTALLRDHELSLPPDLSLLIKAMISLEGLGRQLDPDFDMVDEARPMLERAMRKRYSPQSLAKRGWQGLAGVMDLLIGLPRDLRRIVSAARRGSLQVHVDVTRLKDFGDQLDRAASRMAIGNVTAALIIGSAIVMTVEGGPILLGLPLFGLLGFCGAAISGVWLLWSVWRSGRG